jgi:Restriction endonuclease
MPLLTPDPFPDLPEWTLDVPADDTEVKWRLYEKVVADMQERYSDCTVIRDHKVTGVRSGTTRQIDVWVTGEVAGREIKLAIECKFYKAKVDIKTVDSFIGFLEDVGADKGVLITTTGFTSGAEKRAKAARIDLEVMSLESAMETDWGDYVGNSCQALGCTGDISWDYSEGGPRFGTCDHCGQLHIECGECGHVDEYNVGCDRSIGSAHVRCKDCNGCFIVGVEKGDVTDISSCTRHKSDDTDDKEDD